MKYNTIIWDWNGTLLNDNWLCLDIINEMLIDRDLEELSMLRYKDIFGFPIIRYYQRWTLLLNSLSPTQLTRKFIHPEHGLAFSLDENIGIYAWHGNHHLAQIEALKNRMEWI